MRKPFVAGNWKMNTDSHSSVSLAEGVAGGSLDIAGRGVDVAVIPPFVYLQAVVKTLNRSNIAVGAQDIYYEQNGAFTGEVSPSMLKDVGCIYVLCGHSERRHVLGESDELVNKKVTAAIYWPGYQEDFGKGISSNGVWRICEYYRSSCNRLSRSLLAQINT